MMKNKRIPLLSLVTLLVSAMVFGNVSFGQYGNGEDSPGSRISEMNKGKNIMKKMVKNNKNENKKSSEDKRKEDEKRNNELRFGKPALRTQDRDTINGKINHVPQGERLDFLLRVIGKIAKLETNISNSNMLPERKTAYLDMLEAIRILVQGRIDELTGTGTTDVTPPTVSSFSLVGVNTSSATFSTTISEKGTGYYVLLASGATAPTAAQVKLGQDASGTGVVLKGTMSLTGGLNTFTIPNLPAGQTYTIYFAVTDLSGNLQTATFSLTFTTTIVADTTPPVLTAFSATGVTATGVTLSVNVNETGTGYYILLASGATAPTATQVKLGQDASGTGVTLKGSLTTVSGVNTILVSPLTPSTAYTAHFTAEDASANLQTTVQTVGFTTLSQ